MPAASEVPPENALSAQEPDPPEPGARVRCAVCGTVLSGYNAGPHCWRHSVGMPWRGPSAKPKYD